MQRKELEGWMYPPDGLHSSGFHLCLLLPLYGSMFLWLKLLLSSLCFCSLVPIIAVSSQPLFFCPICVRMCKFLQWETPTVFYPPVTKITQKKMLKLKVSFYSFAVVGMCWSSRDSFRCMVWYRVWSCTTVTCNILTICHPLNLHFITLSGPLAILKLT